MLLTTSKWISFTPCVSWDSPWFQAPWNLRWTSRRVSSVSPLQMRNEGNISKGEEYRGLCCRSAEGKHRQHQDLSTWESLHSLGLVQRVVRTLVRRVGTSSLSLCWLDTRTSSWLGMWTMEELPSLTHGSSPATWLPPDGQGSYPKSYLVEYPVSATIQLRLSVADSSEHQAHATFCFHTSPCLPRIMKFPIQGLKTLPACKELSHGHTLWRTHSQTWGGRVLRMALYRTGGKWAWTELRHAGGRLIRIHAWGTLHWGTELKAGRK